MTLKEIAQHYQGLSIYEERCSRDDYHELVFCNTETDAWCKVFADVLGPAVKPSGVRPARDHARLTDEYGGIQANQTLFKKEFENSIILVMLWPWQDNEHTTLKIICVSSAG